jgi:outer membrane biosynthesis protein TonB
MDARSVTLLLSIVATLGCGTAEPMFPRTSGRAGRGSLDRKVVKEIIREHHKEVRACYEMGLARQPDVAGRVQSAFTVSTAGDVVAVDIRDSTLGSPAIEECVRRRVFSWKFPKPVGGNADVSYVFNFFPHP